MVGRVLRLGGRAPRMGVARLTAAGRLTYHPPRPPALHSPTGRHWPTRTPTCSTPTAITYGGTVTDQTTLDQHAAQAVDGSKMAERQHERIIEVLAELRRDVRRDVHLWEGMAFTGHNVSAALGVLAAQVDALAHVLETLMARDQHTAHAVDGGNDVTDQTTAPTTGAALLREAATLMQEDPDARWRAVADWLESEANKDDYGRKFTGHGGVQIVSADAGALATARAFLGRSS